MRDQLFAKIDLHASRLKPYEGFIFLCGGKTDIRSHEPVSIRDAMYRELAKDAAVEKRVRVAEHYKDWSHESIYRDLVSFERHLAELSSVIVLVLESPGSIAELGLFSVVEEFQAKLLVFIETDHYQSPSFIKLGPVDYLEKIHSNSAECHRWMAQVDRRPKFDPKAAQELQPELAEAVLKRAQKPAPEHTFRTASWLDTALLLCDFLSLCSALTLREMRGLLEQLGHPKAESELKQYLFILQKVGLIAVEPKGDQRFYVGIEDRQFYWFHIREGTVDFSRFRANQIADYAANDKKRFRAIQEVRRRYAPR
ncbi:retron St85 family effector protein [Rubrivivax gelatinosus]|uniref:retron St85 family effector protein n=1 Tax=Rubrivivax gelatinosus TaxID=28068 RepID=UPI001906DC13|nr:retron St85 family effector protein [Rubrivivax gelatinosus]